MPHEEFDLEAAMARVRTDHGRRGIERAFTFLPPNMRAESRKEPTIRSVPKPKDARNGQQVALGLKGPDWQILGQSVQTSVHPIGKIPPVKQTQEIVVRNGCSICGNTTVTRDGDGVPYSHTCSHRRGCRTEAGHPTCPDCDRILVERAGERVAGRMDARRAFLDNVKRADEAAPRVGFDFVEVRHQVSCPVCQQSLDGKRAARVWAWNQTARTWEIVGLQCVRHVRPGIPMADLSANYFHPVSDARQDHRNAMAANGRQAPLKGARRPARRHPESRPSRE